eukprot:14758215-Alexandrium_andersonii.AAC.1
MPHGRTRAPHGARQVLACRPAQRKRSAHGAGADPCREHPAPEDQQPRRAAAGRAVTRRAALGPRGSRGGGRRAPAHR